MLKITFEFERETKNTIRFSEALKGPLDTPIVGTLYVSKSGLKELGYTPGDSLAVEIDIAK